MTTYKRKWKYLGEGAMPNGTGTGDEKGITLALEIARFTGRIEAECERFERSRALPPGFVAGRVSALLATPQIREGLGHSDLLRYLRAGSGEATEALEDDSPAPKVAKRAYTRRARVTKPQRRKQWRDAKRAQRKRGGQKGFKYEGTHWMQRPENKARVKKMMKERAAKRDAKKAAATVKAAA